MPILELVADLGTGMFYTLDGDETVIGRLSECEIVLHETLVSRRHARVFRGRDGDFVEDLGSRNGTLLNGRPLTKPTRLSHGDQIQIAEATFVFREKPGAAVVDRPPDVTGTIVFDPQALDRPTANPAAQLQAIFGLSKSLAGSLSEDRIRLTILKTLFEVFPRAERGFVLVPGADGELQLATRKTREPSDADGGPLLPLCRRAWKERQAILFVDEPLPGANDGVDGTVDAAGLRSLMCAPLVATEEHVVGVVQIDRDRSAQPFDMGDLELLSAVCTMAGRAIENTRMHAEHLEAQLQERELQVAAGVQRMLVPSDPPAVEGFRIAHLYEPARHVGGDYCDFVPLADGRLVVAIGDVSGKDVSAALLMARLNAAVQLCVEDEHDLGEVVRRLNRVAVLPNMTMRFVTFLLAMLDPRRKEVDLVCAGHLPPVVCRADGSTAVLEDVATGPPLGVEEDGAHSAVSVPLAPGDGMLLFTDGVTEAKGGDGELYGFERIGAAMARARAEEEDVPRAVVEDARRFAGPNGLSDDVCVVEIRRVGW